MLGISNNTEFVDSRDIRIRRVVIPERGAVLEWPRQTRSLAIIAFVLQLNGRAICVHDRERLDLAPGQWHAHAARSWRVEPCGSHVEQAVLFVPRAQLSDFTTTAALTLHPSYGASDTSKLLCHQAAVFLRAWQRGDTLNTQDLASALHCLLNCAVRERVWGAYAMHAPSEFERLRRAARAIINAELQDPLLSTQQLARRLHCSARHLQRAFKETGEPLAKLILNHRLDRCYSDLIDPANREISITDIAVRWGFSDMTSFSGAFKQRFGYPPREARKAMQTSL